MPGLASLSPELLVEIAKCIVHDRLEDRRDDPKPNGAGSLLPLVLTCRSLRRTFEAEMWRLDCRTNEYRAVWKACQHDRPEWIRRAVANGAPVTECHWWVDYDGPDTTWAPFQASFLSARIYLWGEASGEDKLATPLMLAIACDSTNAAQALLEAGADLHNLPEFRYDTQWQPAREEWGSKPRQWWGEADCTPLHAARSMEMMRLLLANGCERYLDDSAEDNVEQTTRSEEGTSIADGSGFKNHILLYNIRRRSGGYISPSRPRTIKFITELLDAGASPDWPRSRHDDVDEETIMERPLLCALQPRQIVPYSPGSSWGVVHDVDKEIIDLLLSRGARVTHRVVKYLATKLACWYCSNTGCRMSPFEEADDFRDGKVRKPCRRCMDMREVSRELLRLDAAWNSASVKVGLEHITCAIMIERWAVSGYTRGGELLDESWGADPSENEPCSGDLRNLGNRTLPTPKYPCYLFSNMVGRISSHAGSPTPVEGLISDLVSTLPVEGICAGYCGPGILLPVLEFSMGFLELLHARDAVRCPMPGGDRSIVVALARTESLWRFWFGYTMLHSFVETEADLPQLLIELLRPARRGDSNLLHVLGMVAWLVETNGRRFPPVGETGGTTTALHLLCQIPPAVELTECLRARFGIWQCPSISKPEFFHQSLMSVSEAYSHVVGDRGRPWAGRKAGWDQSTPTVLADNLSEHSDCLSFSREVRHPQSVVGILDSGQHQQQQHNVGPACLLQSKKDHDLWLDGLPAYVAVPAARWFARTGALGKAYAQERQYAVRAAASALVSSAGLSTTQPDETGSTPVDYARRAGWDPQYLFNWTDEHRGQEQDDDMGDAETPRFGRWPEQDARELLGPCLNDFWKLWTWSRGGKEKEWSFVRRSAPVDELGLRALFG